MCISEGYIKIKFNLNFYLHTALWCLKRIKKALKKYENENLGYFFLFVRDRDGKG